MSNKRSVKVGFIGLGKLGLPVSAAIESRGKKVVGYDVNTEIYGYIKNKKVPYKEHKIDRLLRNTTIETVNSIEDVVKRCNLIFCAVQTPHDDRFEGNKPIKDSPVDFDYSYLKKAVSEVVEAAEKLDEETTLVVISTCLPGTYKNEIKPLLSPKVNYIYNPFFIAMGTVIKDFLNPEFVLIGNDNGDTTQLTNFYKMIHGKDHTFITDITTAEGIKVLYNTYITSKIVFANIYGEMAHKLDMNADDIYKALGRATDRIISTRYLESGVGDGGGCHPRDNIALSYLAKKHGISANLFEYLIDAREKHMQWLADLALEESNKSGLSLIVLGKAFKPESNLQTGSPAILLAHLLNDAGAKFKHYDLKLPKKLQKAVYMLATKHEKYPKLNYPKGSIVIDPFRYVPKEDGVKVISIGGKN